jgi:hypothetical protein
MRRILFCIIAVFAALFVVSGGPQAASAATHGQTGVQTQRSCNFGTDHWNGVWGSKNMDTIQYMYAVWTANPCGQRLQTRATCHNFILNKTYDTPLSGAVKGVGVQAERECGLDESMLVGSVHFTKADGTYYPWRTVCAPCG